MEEEREEGAERYHRGLKEAPVHRAPRDCDKDGAHSIKHRQSFLRAQT